MQKIFFGDKPIILTTKIQNGSDFKNLMMDSIDLKKIFTLLKKSKYNSIRLIGNNDEHLLSDFLKLLPNVVAGGGKVFNPSGKILFIFRNGKWDLPKGKAQKNETIDQTAIREVKEETGVKRLHLGNPLEITYHIFKKNKKYYIKKTYWFEMTTSYDGDLSPQLDEGITKVKWVGPKKLKKIKKNMYANIKSLVY